MGIDQLESELTNLSIPQILDDVPALTLATRYDALNAALFWSAGGSRRLRGRLVDALEVESRDRVLDLGCGTGQTAALLVERGADVVAVDALGEMLEGARGRASGARLVKGDVFYTDVGGGYDRVVLSFVLHNFGAADRVRLLRRAAAALAPAGRVGILEWALPPGRGRAALWRRLLATIEPSHTVSELLDGALAADVHASGLQVVRCEPVAGGRGQLLVLAMGGDGPGRMKNGQLDARAVAAGWPAEVVRPRGL